MKPEDPFHNIGVLLRSNKPDPRPSPGLESRILRELHRRAEPAEPRVWPWFLLPPAAAMAVVLMWPAPAPTVARHEPSPPATTTVEPAAAEGGQEFNPLQAETRALGRDAERAGRFLIDCLPSFSPP